MLSELGRIRVEEIENTNLIAFTDTVTHLYNIWLLVKINHMWYGVNNSGNKFTEESFETKEELVEYFRKKENTKDLKKFCVNRSNNMFLGADAFASTLNYIAESFEKNFNENIEEMITDIIEMQ